MFRTGGSVATNGRALPCPAVEVDGEKRLLPEHDNSEAIEFNADEEVEFAAFEFPASLPSGYGILVFYSRIGGVLQVLGCALFGPRGFMGQFGTIDSAVHSDQTDVEITVDGGRNEPPPPIR